MSRKIDWDKMNEIKQQDVIALELCLRHPAMRPMLFAGYEDMPRGKTRLKALKAKLAKAPRVLGDKDFMEFFDAMQAKKVS